MVISSHVHQNTSRLTEVLRSCYHPSLAWKGVSSTGVFSLLKQPSEIRPN